MKMGLYVIYDVVAFESSAVWEAKNHDVAVRKFSEEFRRNEVFRMMQKDMRLRCVGYIDHEKDHIVVPVNGYEEIQLPSFPSVEIEIEEGNDE